MNYLLALKSLILLQSLARNWLIILMLNFSANSLSQFTYYYYEFREIFLQLVFHTDFF